MHCCGKDKMCTYDGKLIKARAVVTRRTCFAEHTTQFFGRTDKK
jgi:hypothetical protein